MEGWITNIMDNVRIIIQNPGIDGGFLFEILYIFCKVRGFKTIIKFFPHEVADLEPIFEYLMRTQEPE